LAGFPGAIRQHHRKYSNSAGVILIVDESWLLAAGLEGTQELVGALRTMPSNHIFFNFVYQRCIGCGSCFVSWCLRG
jgi:hypothetical protein